MTLVRKEYNNIKFILVYTVGTHNIQGSCYTIVLKQKRVALVLVELHTPSLKLESLLDLAIILKSEV